MDIIVCLFYSNESLKEMHLLLNYYQYTTGTPKSKEITLAKNGPVYVAITSSCLDDYNVINYIYVNGNLVKKETKNAYGYTIYTYNGKKGDLIKCYCDKTQHSIKYGYQIAQVY